MEHISEVLERVSLQNPEPIKTGFKFLDDSIGGYYPGEMTTICGAEGSGKSAFVITQLVHVAVEQRIPTLLVLNSMSEYTFFSCMASYYYGLPAKSINTVFATEAYGKALSDFMGLMKDVPLYFIKANWGDDMEFFEKLEGPIRDKGIKIAFFDEVLYVLNEVPDSVINCHKLLAQKMNIPVVCTACVWNDREGLIGLKPALKDLCNICGLHGNDVVLGFTDYAQNGIHVDEQGRDLHDKICIEILKYKGRLKNRNFLVLWRDFLAKDSSVEQESVFKPLDDIYEHRLDKLINDMDLEKVD